MTIAAFLYGPPRYNLANNSISDLQAVTCGKFQGNIVCSPAHDVANAAVILLGLFLIIGTLLIRKKFSVGKLRSTGLGFLLLAGIGAVGNGFTPEDLNLPGDFLTALAIYLGADLGLIFLGLEMARETEWRSLRVYSVLLGVIGLIAFTLFLVNITGPLGTGGMEWFMTAPILLWMLIIGIHLRQG
jgi:hypothetical membrane protein